MEFYEKLTRLSAEWADADAEAARAESQRKLAYSRAFLIAKASATAAEAAHIAECDEAYQAAVEDEVKAKHRARVAREAKQDAILSFQRWQSIQATEREANRHAT